VIVSYVSYDGSFDIAGVCGAGADINIRSLFSTYELHVCCRIEKMVNCMLEIY